MKENIHPEYFNSTVTCSGCGTAFQTGATQAEIHITICASCHPFYTGKQKLVDTEGRVDKFKKKFEKFYEKKEQ